jgi:hypothetical protein
MVEGMRPVGKLRGIAGMDDLGDARGVILFGVESLQVVFK